MRCSRCQQENPAGVKFCGGCGAKFEARCSQCGAGNPPTNRFCHECGTELAAGSTQPKAVSPDTYTPKQLAEKILTSKAALEGERKQVTVLFADLKGSMELLADRDPEEARKLLDPVLEHMMEAVHRYEGTVNQVMGDGIMALFGAPLAHEDHAVRACYAALRMQESVKRYADGVRRTEGIPIQIRVGLNSGEVVVRSIGSDLHMDYTAVGQTTHLAARMEQMATPGSILVPHETLSLAEGYVVVKPLGPMPVRGLPAPIDVYEVTGATAIRSRLHAASARGLTRFVGRESEVEQLRHALEAAREGHGQVVVVVGEPGVGKSRLYSEFTHSYRTQGWLIVEGGSVSYGKATAFLPILDVLRAYFQIETSDDARKIREKVTGKVLSLDRALEPSLSALLALLDASADDPEWQQLDPLLRRQRTLDGVKRLLLRESQAQPLVILFEDLHWIDAETQAMLDSLVESLPTARLLLLLNCRPEYQHNWSGKTYYRQLRIDPLPPESAEELLEALMGADAGLEPLKRLLIERTEGNPFFLEETVRTLVETRALDGERGAYQLARPVPSLQIPATVQAILAARIDRLPVEEKQLLQTASIIGKDVLFALLTAIAELPATTLRRALDHLQEAEFLYETQLFPDLEYTFKHVLTQEVAYAGLLHDRRRQLHAAVVDAIESHHAGRVSEQAERLAYHAVRGALWEKAATHLWQSGQNARARSAYRQASAFLEQAVEALRRLPDTAENAARRVDLVCRDLSDPLYILEDYPRLLEYLREAAGLAEKCGDRARLAGTLARTLRPLRVTGQIDRALEIGEQACVLANEIGNPRLEALSKMELSSVYHLRGDLRRSESLLMQALAALDAQSPDPDVAESAWLRRMMSQNLVRVLAETGRYREAFRRGEDALRMAEELGHPAPIGWALVQLGRAYADRGDSSKAIDLSARGLALARERDVHNLLQAASSSLGAAYTLAGRTGEAVACLEEAVKVGESTNNLDPSTLITLGYAYLSAKRSKDALRRAREALTACRERAARNVEADALHLVGEIAATLEPPAPEDAAQHYGQALEVATELGMLPLIAHCHLALGKLYRRTGKRQEAHEHLTTATTMYREMEMQFYLEQAETEMASDRPIVGQTDGP
jgi:class 3 adenylate cyclase/tetratricopeptide (TPR) repeat protein